MKTTDFLDAVKKRHGLASDYQLAKFLRWPTQRISMFRTTARELGDDACVQIAAALELPAPYVLACIAEQRAKSSDVKGYWREAAKLLKSGTAAALLVGAMLAAQPAPSAESLQLSALTSPSIHYAHWRGRRSLPTPRRRRRRILRRTAA
jgi:hypothetical protein